MSLRFCLSRGLGAGLPLDIGSGADSGQQKQQGGEMHDGAGGRLATVEVCWMVEEVALISCRLLISPGSGFSTRGDIYTQDWHGDPKVWFGGGSNE